MSDNKKVAEELRLRVLENIKIGFQVHIPLIDSLLNEEPLIQETKLSHKKQPDTLPEEMVFSEGKLSKVLLLSIIGIFLTFVLYTSILKDDKVNPSDWLVIIFLSATFGGAAIYSLFFKVSSTGKIIISEEGIKLEGYPIAYWKEVFNTYIVSIGSGKQLRRFFVTALISGYYYEQELSNSLGNNFKGLSHFIELYKNRAHHLS